ncbi:MAG TPA: hypothetical protein VFT50_14130 [Baekduia sp.]|nr:hypothetical protein [Baekduia sp.]
MHPATHRSLRELVASAHALSHRWSRLAELLPDARADLRMGVDAAGGMVAALGELAGTRDVAIGGAASGLGATVGEGMARIGEPFLERNQALRTAVLDVHHLTVLLHYVERLARAQDDDELAASCHHWAHELVAVEGRVREAAIAEGDEPDRAVQPVDASAAGRVAHRVAVGVGSAGEWMDRRIG